MKTSLQELIYLLKEAKDRVEPTNDYARGMIGATELSIIKATELLDKEKEIIKDAYREGQIDEGYERKHKDATDYYEKTYNQ